MRLAQSEKSMCLAEPIGEVLQRACLELGRIASLVDDLERVVSTMPGRASEDRADQIIQLQKFDQAKQQIDAMTDFLGALSCRTDSTWLIDAHSVLNCLKLAAVASRLGGEVTERSGPGPGPGFTMSCVELFID